MAGNTGYETPVNKEWNWHPALPVKVSPLFDWPLRFKDTGRWFLNNWFPLTEYIIYALMAVVSWVFFMPDLAFAQSFQPGWIFAVWLKNIALMTLFAGGLHLWLYTWGKQGKRYQYDQRGVTASGKKYTFDTQLKDNVFWTLVSGVGIWTLYEVVIWWAFANGFITRISFSENPVWFIALLLLLPVIQSFHFYWVHRFLHWKPMFRLAHIVHHHNISIGPWSGLSMHPIEHIIYLSLFLVFLLIPSHPIHFIFLIAWLTLATATSHSGYENICAGERAKLTIGSYFHQLHHRYFDCNYGNPEMPWDRWFGSENDGTAEGLRKTREYQRKLRG